MQSGVPVQLTLVVTALQVPTIIVGERFLVRSARAVMAIRIKLVVYIFQQTLRLSERVAGCHALDRTASLQATAVVCPCYRAATHTCAFASVAAKMSVGGDARTRMMCWTLEAFIAFHSGEVATDFWLRFFLDVLSSSLSRLDIGRWF